MTTREILTSENPILRQRARKVRAVTSEIRALIQDMIETMRAAPGVGLAAPQVGVSQRVIVVEYAEEPEDPQAERKPPKLYAVVNPEIVRHSAAAVVGNEACLSVPGLYGEVERFESVTVKGLNRNGGPFRLKAEGWLARVFQHELDHLDGVLYIDKASTIWKVEEGQQVEAAAD